MKLDKKFKIITHNGRFHADELFAIALLKKFYCNIENIERTRDQNLLKEGLKDKQTILVDVGEVYDNDNHAFDHHQQSCKEFWHEFFEGKKQVIPLSSTGLVFRFLENKGLLNEFSVSDLNYIKKEFIIPIDAADNRMIDFKKGMILMDFNKQLSSVEKENKQFYKALNLAIILLDDLVENAKEHSLEIKHTKECVNSAIKIFDGKKEYTVIYVPQNKAFNEEKIVDKTTKIDFIVNEVDEGLYNIRTTQSNEKDKIYFKHQIPDYMVDAYHKNNMKDDWSGQGVISFIHKNGFFSVVKGEANDAIHFIKTILSHKYDFNIKNAIQVSSNSDFSKEKKCLKNKIIT